jgi:hypothetical protein
MREPQKTSPRPPLERKTRPPQKEKVNTSGLISIATMLVSLAAISIAMFGGVKLIFDILDSGIEGMKGIPVKIVVLAFSFVFGWATGLVSIRGFGNQLYPIIIKIYALGSLVATGFLYFKIIKKLYEMDYDAPKFGIYLIILIGVLFVLFCMHLLVEGHDLRPFAIPLLIISVIHLFVIVYHFVFIDGEDVSFFYVTCDFTVFILMITISGLMLLHIGIFSPVRSSLGVLFSTKAADEDEGGNVNGVR